MKSEVVQKLDLELNLLAGTVSRFTATNTNNTLNIYKYQVCLPDKWGRARLGGGWVQVVWGSSAGVSLEWGEENVCRLGFGPQVCPGDISGGRWAGYSSGVNVGTNNGGGFLSLLLGAFPWIIWVVGDLGWEQLWVGLWLCGKFGWFCEGSECWNLRCGWFRNWRGSSLCKCEVGENCLLGEMCCA